jgi:hypothetical protein
LGAGGRWFKSSRPDQSFQADVPVLKTDENRAKKSPSRQNQLGWGTLRMVAWATRQNFLKHADRDPDAEIKPVKTKQLAMVILTAIQNYTLLTQHWTIEMQTFFVWIAVAEPQLVKSAPEDVVTNKAIAEMRSYISGDPYDRDTLTNIYTAMRLQL